MTVLQGTRIEELAMSTTVECPSTFARVTINIKDDKQAVNQGWNRSVAVQCPPLEHEARRQV